MLRDISESDQNAFKQLFYLYYASLFNHAYHILKSSLMSEEVVSEVFFTLWKNRALIVEVQNIEAYLHVAVKNKAISCLRQVAAHRMELTSDDAIAAFTTENHNPESEAIRRELQSALQAAIEDLPTKCRAIFKMARINGLSYKKISELLGISVRTVDAQLAIAQKKLRLSLQHYMEE
ncbi:MAG: RNA polymerase sigma-70 factor [Bacteroidales bacterium]|nr:RNA polymerase sigma-70 factor [Bacteroidales bacterium]